MGNEAMWLGHRQAARRRLLELCPGVWCRSGKIKYYSHLGSRSNTRSEAGDEVADVLMAALLGTRPPIPAINRWNKVHGPLAWWSFGLNCFGLVVDAFERIRGIECPEDNFLDDINAVAPADEETYRKLKKLRWTKASTFFVCSIDYSTNVHLHDHDQILVALPGVLVCECSDGD